MSNLIGHNDHYDHQMLGDGAKAPEAAKEAERYVAALAHSILRTTMPSARSRLHPFEESRPDRVQICPPFTRPTKIQEKPLDPNSLAFPRSLVPHRLFRRHSSSKSKHDNELHPQAKALQNTA